MKLNKFLSLKSLIILGFVIAVIPLFIAVMYAALGLREASALSQSINSQVFEQTKTVNLVLQKTADIERKARLFVLLSDPAIRQPYEQQSYENTRESLKQALSELLKLHIDNKVSLLVNELSEKEDLIYQEIISSASENTIKLPIDEAFQGLRESSANLSREYESHIDNQFNELRQKSASLEHELSIKGAILLVVSCIFIWILLTVISRSIQQLDSGIRRLGSGQFKEPIKVTGPLDLRYLGNRLEWLRIHLMELEISNQKFMFNVAREINQPIATINENTERLLNETTQDPELSSAHQDIVEQLRNHVDQLKTVSEDLIRFSEIAIKPTIDDKESVNMKTLLDSVIMDFQPRLITKSINLISMARPVELSGIPDQLKSIIEQLLSNAVKYSPIGGEIRIMLRDSGTQMELEIEDEGPGIDPDDLPHIFEPFFRGKSSLPDESSEGSGLGLAIVKEYVANHQGKVDIIDSRQGQQGARILVQIPLTEED